MIIIVIGKYLSGAKIMQIESKKASLLDFFAECSLSYSKIMQIESKKASLLDFFCRVPPILFKDNANREQKLLIYLPMLEHITYC